MKAEIFSLDTAAKVAKYDKALKFVKDKIEEYEKMNPNELCSEGFRYCGLDELYDVLEILEGDKWKNDCQGK